MKKKPSLFKLSVIFTWLRVAYEEIRDELHAAVDAAKARYLKIDQDMSKGRAKDLPKAKATYVHLFNLLCLFEFFIPSVQDYGLALKLQDVQIFKQKLFNLLSVFTMLQTVGSNMYSRSLYIFLIQWLYWEKEKVCYCVSFISS